MLCVWEQRKFDDLFVERRDRTKVENEDKLISCAINGMFLNSELFSHFRGSTTIGYLKIKKNDLILSAQNLHLGNANVNLRFESGIISPAYKVYEIQDCHPYFINAWVKDERTNSFFLRATTEGASVCRKNIEWKALGQQTISIPSIEEQNKIGEYFHAIDNLITLHQRTNRYIFYYISSVWEQRKLSEVTSKIGSGKTPKGGASAYKEEGIALIRSQNVNGDRVDLSDVVFIDEQTDEEMKNSRVLKGDVLLNITGASIGRSAVFTRDLPANVNQHVCIIRPTSSDISSEFIQLNIISTAGQNQIDSFQAGGGREGLNFQQIAKMEFSYPSIGEQRKIGAYFSNLDTLITLHHRKSCFLKYYFIHDWEQRKFGETVIIERGGSPRPIDSYITNDENGLNWVKIGDAPKQGNYITKTAEKIRPEGLKKTREVHPGDLILSNSMSFGRPYIMAIDGCIHDGWLLIRDEDKQYDLKFLCQMLGTDQMLSQYKAMAAGSTVNNLNKELVSNTDVKVPNIDEQMKIGEYFSKLDNLITLHHRKSCLLKCYFIYDWEQRKFSEVFDGLQNNTLSRAELNDKSGQALNVHYGDILVKFGNCVDVSKEQLPYITDSAVVDKYKASFLQDGDIVIADTAEDSTVGKCTEIAGSEGMTLISGLHTMPCRPKEKFAPKYLGYYMNSAAYHTQLIPLMQGIKVTSISKSAMQNTNLVYPTSMDEQAKIGEYFSGLDTLITLHQRKQNWLKKASKYIKIIIITLSIIFSLQKEMTVMPELEAVIEQKLIEQLVYGDSQWNYRPDLKTEEDLWKNFRYILEQNNKDRLNGESLSDSEFEQVKNQLQFSSFYKAGEWLVGENGKVQVHVQRDTERLHLVVMNHEHIAGGSSVYEVINQYSVLKSNDEGHKVADKRFDVTLLINGLPMIHIELKNKQHSYMDGFWQIKKYIGEGKFTGIFSAVQMFVISNGVNTKYFSAASDTELNPKFISGWLDHDNNPVSDYLDFAKCVLRIPEAHEMIARYTVLDEDAKRLILLRPYQIHAIEAIREASKVGKSGYVWHTTGSGKTLTSYKATRNLLMDIPSIDKTIFLIDRKDLDTQTTQAFQAYANNDLIDVDETENVNDLKKKLKSDDRQVIVTTIQKLYQLISKRLTADTPEYNKIKNLKIAFVVDECHRAVTPNTKRELERFFGKSLWFGFTGTPRFAENPYPQLGDLPRTTEELYGKRLHKYTIQNAIHDNAVLGFQVEHNGPKNLTDETDAKIYDNETHMLNVLDVILNKSYHKLGFQNGKGKTYEGLLTTSSIHLAQKYYELLMRVKKGETSLVIDERIKQVLPDFPKFAITYSVSENEEGSQVNQQKMQQSLDDYNEMFGTKYETSQIQGYNANLNKRLARKDAKYKSRNEQLDLVIVVDRLLTGFDAPCMSTIFIDRQPMGPHDLIQAFSRTNRIFDKNKSYGQIVTFQAPKLFKESVDEAVKLYSAGSTDTVSVAEWDEVEPAFRKALSALRICAQKPSDIPGMSLEEKKVFVKIFQNFDRLFAQLKSFTCYEESMLSEYGITEDEYYDYAGHYLNALEEIKPGPEPDPNDDPPATPVLDDYELMAYSHTKIDYEYIINLIQNIVTPAEDVEVSPEERQRKIDEVKQYVEELRKDNPKVADIMAKLIYEIELDEKKYQGQSILNIIENTKQECIEKVITDFCITWYAEKGDVMYAATHYRNGEIPNESAIKANIDFTSYKNSRENALPKFKYYAKMIAELRKTLDEEIKPLINH